MEVNLYRQCSLNTLLKIAVDYIPNIQSWTVNAYLAYTVQSTTTSNLRYKFSNLFRFSCG